MVRADRIPEAMNDGSISTDLCQFLATNFHQDWDLEADSWEGIVDNYVNEDPAAEPLRMLASGSTIAPAADVQRVAETDRKPIPPACERN